MATKVTILDGSMGTTLRQRYPERVAKDPLWSARLLVDDEGSAKVQQLHEDYTAAGADIITANNYACVPVYTAHAPELSFEDLTVRAVKIAREAAKKAGRPVKVAASLPPLRQSYSTTEGSLPRSADLDTYRKIVAAADPLADLYIIETIAAGWAAEAPLAAAKPTGKPVYASYTVHDDTPTGCLRSGETLKEALSVFSPDGPTPDGVLFNCSTPTGQSAALAALLSGIAEGSFPFEIRRCGAYANAFAPIPKGWNHHTDGHPPDVPVPVEEYTRTVKGWLELLDAHNAKHPDKTVSFIVGGCCGVGPEHIAAVAAALESRREKPAA
ncbi:Methionine synthase [Diplonema papillatum]|nr:Methionine synthase [Diplonema papillatum]|eukprot:gene7625-11678_t